MGINSPAAAMAIYDAHNAVSVARRFGDLIPEPCEVCWTEERVNAHHEDYSKPLAVRWLCPAHHRQRHSQLHREGLKFQRPNASAEYPAALSAVIIPGTNLIGLTSRHGYVTLVFGKILNSFCAPSWGVHREHRRRRP